MLEVADAWAAAVAGGAAVDEEAATVLVLADDCTAVSGLDAEAGAAALRRAMVRARRGWAQTQI